jgi:hypothetical protein
MALYFEIYDTLDKCDKCGNISLDSIATKNDSTWTLKAETTISDCQTLTIDVGVYFVIPENLILFNNGIIVNNGSIDINYVLVNGGTIKNTGIVNIKKSFTNLNTIDNNGTLNIIGSSSYFFNSGTITNKSENTLNSYGTIFNTGIFINLNDSVIINETNAIFTNSEVVTFYLRSSFINSGKFNNNKTTFNDGTFTNNIGGTLTSTSVEFSNTQNTSTFTNNGILIVSSGKFIIYSGNNSGTITVTTTGTTNTEFFISTIPSTPVFINTGTITSTNSKFSISSFINKNIITIRKTLDASVIYRDLSTVSTIVNEGVFNIIGALYFLDTSSSFTNNTGGKFTNSLGGKLEIKGNLTNNSDYFINTGTGSTISTNTGSTILLDSNSVIVNSSGKFYNVDSAIINLNGGSFNNTGTFSIGGGTSSCTVGVITGGMITGTGTQDTNCPV